MTLQPSLQSRERVVRAIVRLAERGVWEGELKSLFDYLPPEFVKDCLEEARTRGVRSDPTFYGGCDLGDFLTL